MKSLFQSFRNIQRISSTSNAQERYVALQIARSFPARDYVVLNNVLIPCSTRIGTSQIDHVIVSIHGIFCIETKSHAGWIFGSQVRNLFTQVLYRNKYPIVPNPVTQNATHIKALRELLGSKVKAPIVNIVVFPSADRFFIDGYKNVGSVEDLIGTIMSYSEKIYHYQEAKEIIETIHAKNMKHPAAHAYHVHAIKAVYT